MCFLVAERADVGGPLAMEGRGFIGTFVLKLMLKLLRKGESFIVDNVLEI
ncbi:hypothetical protein YC2023_037495 [Brassica napus]